MSVDLFTYPHRPGFKARDTAAAAADAAAPTAGTLRDRVMEIMRAREDATADEIADAMGMSVLTIRPRVSELGAKGDIVDSGKRRANASGKKAIAWRVFR